MAEVINHEMRALQDENRQLKRTNKKLSESLDDVEDKLEGAELALAAYRFLTILGWAALIGLFCFVMFGME